MNTPREKQFLNLFTSSKKVNDIFGSYTNISPYDFSFQKNFRRSTNEKLSPYNSETVTKHIIYRSQEQNKSNINVKKNKENCKQIHKLEVKKSKYQINNINFDIQCSFLK